jgi:hypothetical protein
MDERIGILEYSWRAVMLPRDGDVSSRAMVPPMMIGGVPWCCVRVPLARSGLFVRTGQSHAAAAIAAAAIGVNGAIAPAAAAGVAWQRGTTS